MTRLCKYRSLPSKLSKSNKKIFRNNRICSRKFAHSAGILELSRNYVSHRMFSRRIIDIIVLTLLTEVVNNIIGSLESQDEISILIEPYLKSRKEAWLVLALFCALLCMQCCIWNTWGPIAASVLIAFPSWNQSMVALLSDWGCISYLTCCVPCCWILYNKGFLVNAIRNVKCNFDSICFKYINDKYNSHVCHDN